MGYLSNFKFHCKYIDPLIKSLLATTVVSPYNSKKIPLQMSTGYR